MTTTKRPSPLLLVFILLNLLMVAATFTFSPWAWPVQSAAAHRSTVLPAAGHQLAPTQHLEALLTPLLQPATAVVYGQIVAYETTWNLAHTQIETHFTLSVSHTLIGQVAEQIEVSVPGGYLPTEAIGMWSSHTATFANGEVVLLFLAQSESGYAVVQGEKGKFTLGDTYLSNPTLALTVLPTAVEQAIQVQATKVGRTVHLPSNHATLYALVAQSVVSTPFAPSRQAQLLTQPTWPNTTIAIKINLNSDGIGDRVDAFRAAIFRAMRSWSVVTDADFTLLYDGETTATITDYNGVNELLFMHKGANSQLGQAQIWFTQNGTILEADIWINDDYTFSVSDTPAVGETDLESVVLHELGHWIPLDHTPESQAVMYAILNASTKRVLQPDDLNRLIATYPCGASPCINDLYLNPTETPFPTSTPTLVPTTEATPTLIVTVPPPTGVKSMIYLPFVTR